MPKCKICYMLQPISYAGFVPQLYKKTTNVLFQANQKHLKHYECGRFPQKNVHEQHLGGGLFCLLGGLFHRGLNFLSNI